ncbi:MAG: nucleotidyltransferase substrate binding protein [Chitinophagaceae bacterium]|nr:nucleotidyltransferase substrate binding protein [Chitinophagaceae bacterium]
MKAMESFQKCLSVNMFLFDKEIQDYLNNAKIQKFEYTTELLWKTMRLYLIIHKYESNDSPKGTYKDLLYK